MCVVFCTSKGNEATGTAHIQYSNYFLHYIRLIQIIYLFSRIKNNINSILYDEAKVCAGHTIKWTNPAIFMIMLAFKSLARLLGVMWILHGSLSGDLQRGSVDRM